MSKLSTRIIIAALTFLLGVAATTVWFINRQPRELRLDIPNAGWEPIFFRDINAAAKFSGQTDLRQTKLAEGDVEVRVWWGGGLSPLEGITLRRVAGRWSALHTKADSYSRPQKAERTELRPPKSGWEAVWQRLVSRGILTLPDASELNCDVGGLDGGAYVVEVNKDNAYRTYMYDMPSEAECNEARQMMEIGDTLFEEFLGE